MFRFIRTSIHPLFQTQLRSGNTKRVPNCRFNITQIRLLSHKFDANVWIENLDEAQQKRIRFVQNEVRFVQSLILKRKVQIN